MNTASEFEQQLGMTYKEAVAFLKARGLWKNVAQGRNIDGGSYDGYSIVYYAAHLRDAVPLDDRPKDALK